MISTDLRGLIASMKAHVDADMMGKGFFAVFEQRLRALADDIEVLEGAAIPVRLRRAALASGARVAQLELIEGGRK